MEVKGILAAIDQEIANLEKAKAILTGTGARVGRRGGTARKKKRQLSPEGRKRIQEALRKRWAAVRAKKSAK